MKNRCLWKTLVAFALIQSLVGCSRNTEQASDSFTLETGVALQEFKACDAKQGVQEQISSVKKLSDGYEVSVSAFFACNADVSRPYLTVTNQKKTTLVVNPSTSKEVFSSSCECARSLVIRLTNRLEAGDTLYVLREHEVLGHLMMP